MSAAVSHTGAPAARNNRAGFIRRDWTHKRALVPSLPSPAGKNTSRETSGRLTRHRWHRWLRRNGQSRPPSKNAEERREANKMNKTKYHKTNMKCLTKERQHRWFSFIFCVQLCTVSGYVITHTHTHQQQHNLYIPISYEPRTQYFKEFQLSFTSHTSCAQWFQSESNDQAARLLACFIAIGLFWRKQRLRHKNAKWNTAVTTLWTECEPRSSDVK